MIQLQVTIPVVQIRRVVRLNGLVFLSVPVKPHCSLIAQTTVLHALKILLEKREKHGVSQETSHTFCKFFRKNSGEHYFFKDFGDLKP